MTSHCATNSCPFALRALFAIPVIGWALECLLMYDHDSVRLLGFGVLIMTWVLAIMAFGFSAFLYPLYGLVALAFAFALTLTRG
ncbi:MAG: hypothetical protein ACK4MF_09700 [Hyphomicrobiaceae bacterium]